VQKSKEGMAQGEDGDYPLLRFEHSTVKLREGDAVTVAAFVPRTHFGMVACHVRHVVVH
jgi:hypothetical protein